MVQIHTDHQIKKTGHRKYHPCHIIIKLLIIQNKEIILKLAREKNQVIHKIRITADFSKKTLNATMDLTKILHVLKNHRLKTRLQYSAKLTVATEGKN